MKSYLNLETLRADITEIYNEVLNSYKNEKYFDLLPYHDEDCLNELIDYQVNKINDDMCTYLHSDDTRIMGNFNNIYSDYVYHDERGDYKDLLKRLDEGATDEKTNDDRDYLTNWFWDTFGTFGMKYNFESEIDDQLYCIEREEKYFNELD